MKKRNRAALVLVAAVLLTACGRTADTAVTTEEIVVPEMSSKDMLVNSLEYFLEEEPEENQTQEEVEEREEETPADQSGQEESETQENENGTEEKGIVICYGKGMEGGLMEETITAEEITPEVLVSALARHNILPLLDMKVLSMEEREEDGKKLLYLDLSGTFREYLQTMSREAECIIISSVANTFLANYDADAIYIMVEGETLITSNAEYAEAIPDYTPGELMSLLNSDDGMEEE
ncbi:MAG: GerMN domain-containing protein [Lachnospiraceae bacterium]|nr:GerMN domain-containing protein [Lachnospiraceae bacterium]